MAKADEATNQGWADEARAADDQDPQTIPSRPQPGPRTYYGELRHDRHQLQDTPAQPTGKVAGQTQ